jgi:putative transcriptional regulator
MTTNTAIERGMVLLAEPFSEDHYFKRAVVLMCEHHPQGSLGFILNKPTDLVINDLIEDFPPFDARVFYGGPVQTDRLHFIHNLGDLLSNSQKITDGVFWGGDFSELQFLIKNDMVTLDNIRFFVGYSGWSAGQLVEEMGTGSWITAEMHANYAFKTKAEELWKLVMYNKGATYEILADLPDESSTMN